MRGECVVDLHLNFRGDRGDCAKMRGEIIVDQHLFGFAVKSENISVY